MIRLFRIFIPIGSIILLVSDMLLVIAAFLLSAYITLEDPSAYLLQGHGILNIGLVLVTILIGLYFNDLYSDVFVKSHLNLVLQICYVMGASFFVQSVVSYLNKNLRMPLHVMVWGAGITAAGIYGWRLFFSSYALHAIGGDRVLLVGSSPILTEIAHHIGNHPETGLRVIG